MAVMALEEKQEMMVGAARTSCDVALHCQPVSKQDSGRERLLMPGVS